MAIRRGKQLSNNMANVRTVLFKTMLALTIMSVFRSRSCWRQQLRRRRNYCGFRASREIRAAQVGARVNPFVADLVQHDDDAIPKSVCRDIELASVVHTFPKVLWSALNFGLNRGRWDAAEQVAARKSLIFNALPVLSARRHAGQRQPTN